MHTFRGTTIDALTNNPSSKHSEIMDELLQEVRDEMRKDAVSVLTRLQSEKDDVVFSVMIKRKVVMGDCVEPRITSN